MNKFISVVVPCKNEELFIECCINAIISQEKSNLIEVIVVDNGSEDRTMAILEKFGSQINILSLPNASIAEVRNHGVFHASANWLAFIDGDVEITHDWFNNLLEMLEREANSGTDITKLVTGSTCTIPENSSWIERVWFAQLRERDSGGNGYINSGHLIVHRLIFEAVGGFNPTLQTGEDELFCEDAVKRGGILRKSPNICAIHHRYPKTLRDFYLRERWHGLGMEKHLSKPWRYRDLILAFYCWILFLALIVSLVARIPLTYSLPLLTICLVFPLFAFSIFRTNGNIFAAMQLTVIFLFYGGAKAVALGDILLVKRFCRKCLGK